ncbi:MAG: HIT domain-containing protein [Candidatus Saccharimonas sp.]
MTAQRSTREQKLYNKNRKAEVGQACPFCGMNPGHPQFVRETKHLKVLRNRTPYSLWDDQGVLDHLMIIPKVHTDKLGDLTPEGAAEFIRLVGEYETQGYALYARPLGSASRSVAHQHTHLIQLNGKRRNLLLMLRKPWYFRLSK